MPSISDGQKPEKADNDRTTFRWRPAMRSVLFALGPAFYLGALALVALTGWAAYGNWVNSGWGPDAAA